LDVWTEETKLEMQSLTARIFVKISLSHWDKQRRGLRHMAIGRDLWLPRRVVRDGKEGVGSTLNHPPLFSFWKLRLKTMLLPSLRPSCILWTRVSLGWGGLEIIEAGDRDLDHLEAS
jgi:hypothetical protein